MLRSADPTLKLNQTAIEGMHDPYVAGGLDTRAVGLGLAAG